MNNDAIIKNAYRINRVYSLFVMAKVLALLLLFVLATYLPSFFYFHKNPLFWVERSEVWVTVLNVCFLLYLGLDLREFIEIFIKPRMIIKRFCKDETSTKIVAKTISKPLLINQKMGFKWWFFKTNFKNKWMFVPIFFPIIFIRAVFLLVSYQNNLGNEKERRDKSRWNMSRITRSEVLGKSYLRMKWEIEDALDEIAKQKEKENVDN